MIQMLTEEEKRRIRGYTNRWAEAQDGSVFSREERDDFIYLLGKRQTGVELAELGISNVLPG